MDASEPGSSRQKRFLEAAIGVTFSAAKLPQLVKYLKGSQQFPGLPLDPDSRWDMIIQLNRYGHPEAKLLAETELKRDSSERAQSSSLAAAVIQPNVDAKKKWLSNVLASENDMKLADMRTVMSHLYPGKQQLFRWQNSDLILRSIEPLTEKRDGMYWSVFGEYLSPSMCTQASVDLMRATLSKTDQFHPSLVKKLKIAHQNDQRCIQQKFLMEQVR